MRSAIPGSPSRAARVAPTSNQSSPWSAALDEPVEHADRASGPGCARPARRPGGRTRAPGRASAEGTGRWWRSAGGGDLSRRATSGERQRRFDHGARTPQLRRVDRVAAVRRAVGLERAEVAQATGLRLEVVAAARVGDGVVQRGGAALDAPDRLVGGGGDDRLGLREVEELDPRRTPAEHPLAEQRVHVHTAQALRLPELRGHRAGLVVGDDELAVLVELEAVDDAAQPRAPEIGLELQLQPDGPDRARILELEVLADERLGVGVELRPLRLGELEVGEVGVGRELDAGRGRDRRARRRASARRPGGRAGARARGARACPSWSTARGAPGVARGRRTGTRAGTP